MKKIGILTFWGVPNYGAFAQAYALNMILKKFYKDDEVKHIAYLHPRHHDLYFKKRKPILQSHRQLLSPWYYYEMLKYLINPSIRYPAFSKDWNLIDDDAISDSIALENTYYDVIVTGSDAIWEYSVPDFGDDYHLVGNNLKCNKLVSYAASFGDMNLVDNFKNFVADGLKKYDLISVRDKNSKDIVKVIAHRDDVQIVLDPTLVWDFKNDLDIPESHYENYILVYGNDFSDTLIRDVKNYAKRNGFIIIGAGIAPEWCDIRLIDIEPLEWIGLFKGAEFTVTCTFHGLMFSINFEKKVVFNQVVYVKNRSTTLLQNLGLYELYKDGTDFASVLNYPWDYKKINERLDSMREESLEFIRNICKDE